MAANARDISGDAAQVRVFVGDATQWYLREDFFDGPAFRSLAQMPQLIADEEDLREARFHVGRLHLSDDEMAAARSDHRALVNATAAYDAARLSVQRRDASEDIANGASDLLGCV